MCTYYSAHRCTALSNGETEDAAIDHSGHGIYFAVPPRLAYGFSPPSRLGSPHVIAFTGAHCLLAPFLSPFLSPLFQHTLRCQSVPVQNTTQCGQFTHTTISPYSIPVAGTWTAGGATLTISGDQWKSNASWGVTDRVVHAFSPTVAIAQVPADGRRAFMHASMHMHPCASLASFP